jgi:hypothetical protein
MFARGEFVLSPISHSHPIAQTGGCSGDWQTWREFDLMLLRMCCRVAVVTLPGWRESVGVQAEIAEARRLGMDVVGVKVDGYWVEMGEPNP